MLENRSPEAPKGPEAPRGPNLQGSRETVPRSAEVSARQAADDIRVFDANIQHGTLT